MPFLVTFDARLELHPMLVHFPVVLLLGSFALDSAGYFVKRDWLHRAGFLALVLGVAAAGAGVASGLATPEAGEAGWGFHTSGGVTGLFSGSKVLVHQNLAFLLLIASGAWLVMRVALWNRSPAWKHAYLGFGVLVVALVMLTGYYGGDIVYGPKVTLNHLSETQLERAGN